MHACDTFLEWMVTRGREKFNIRIPEISGAGLEQLRFVSLNQNRSYLTLMIKNQRLDCLRP